jgi:hypothetical protein
MGGPSPDKLATCRTYRLRTTAAVWAPSDRGRSSRNTPGWFRRECVTGRARQAALEIGELPDQLGCLERPVSPSDVDLLEDPRFDKLGDPEVGCLASYFDVLFALNPGASCIPARSASRTTSCPES